MYYLFISFSLILVSVIAGIIGGIKIAWYGYYLTGGWQLASI